MRDPAELHRQYVEAERKIEPQKARSIARGPIGLVGVLVVLVLAVGVVAAVDLERLQTPRGTALAWTGAAVFGDCRAYSQLSVPDGEETRSEDEVCGELRVLTEPAREQAAQIGIDLLSVKQRGRAAIAEVELRRPQGERVRTERVELPLRREGDGWVVVRTDEVCDVVGCP